MDRFKDSVWCEENVLPLLKKLTHPILTERLNPTNALKEWQALVRKLNIMYNNYNDDIYINGIYGIRLLKKPGDPWPAWSQGFQITE